jgi:predicted O-methyltransferase YrrM
VSERCSLDDPAVRAVLERLHGAARGDLWRFAAMAPTVLRMLLGREPLDAGEQARRFKDVYIPLSRAQGRFLYLVGRTIGARRVVEFGTSFGISTVYAACAVRDNGGGRVFGSELEPGKREAATKNLEEAGLGDLVEIRLGDARETLRDIAPPVDLVLLDGWKELYLPMLELLRSKLRPGSVVLADNIRTFRRALAPYVEYVQSGRHGFRSTTLPLGDGFEYSLYEGPPTR